MIDLHIHSLFSEDGEFPPEELAKRCKDTGLTLFSITDHNCAKANTLAAEAAKAAGIGCLTGIEIDCTYEERGFHLLGDGIDPEVEAFRQIEENTARQNARASRERWEKLDALGLRADVKTLEKLTENACRKGSWTGELLAEVLLADPAYTRHPLLSPYRPGGASAAMPDMLRTPIFKLLFPQKKAEEATASSAFFGRGARETAGAFSANFSRLPARVLCAGGTRPTPAEAE